jgi:hypothetical protein
VSSVPLSLGWVRRTRRGRLAAVTPADAFPPVSPGSACFTERAGHSVWAEPAVNLPRLNQAVFGSSEGGQRQPLTTGRAQPSGTVAPGYRRRRGPVRGALASRRSTWVPARPCRRCLTKPTNERPTGSDSRAAPTASQTPGQHATGIRVSAQGWRYGKMRFLPSGVKALLFRC